MNDKNVRSLVKEVFDTLPRDFTVSAINGLEVEAKDTKSTWEFYTYEFSTPDQARLKVGTVIRFALGHRIFSDGMMEHFRQFSVVTP